MGNKNKGRNASAETQEHKEERAKENAVPDDAGFGVKGSSPFAAGLAWTFTQKRFLIIFAIRVTWVSCPTPLRKSRPRIRETRFLCRGCTTAIACASWLTERLRGAALEDAATITPAEISNSLGGLPPATAHGAHLAADALKALLAQIRAT